ncbi:hypothetical protein EJ03DRAFT_333139 [Teratosphaeria nubilosa]|uniref:Uncharacterized protein n=1 Tax=Teratosphaeria nubilosa TaxID=161662 RepID=A0A6G1LN80_9PEZI|nr:hypothetical protein EJ03DRAFT_333139 [Teratosphaeria nubilosa]
MTRRGPCSVLGGPSDQSTANVPPQRIDWWAEEVKKIPPFSDLPVELFERLMQEVDDFPINWDTACEIREELMEERGRITEREEEKLQRPYYLKASRADGIQTHVAGDILLVDEDDEFGDFEDASATPAPTLTSSGSSCPPSKISTGVPAKPVSKAKTVKDPAKVGPDVGSHPFAGNMDILFAADDEEYDAGQDEMNDIANNPEAAMAYSKRIIAEQQAAQERASRVTAVPPSETVVNAYPQHPQPESNPSKLRKKSGYLPTRDPNVLFDADDVSEHEDEDDFGDFEGDERSSGKMSSTEPPASAETHTIMPEIDLLGLEDSSATATHSVSPETGPAVAQPLQNDVWDDFDIPEPQPTSPFDIPKKKTVATPQRSSTASVTKTSLKPDASSLPPTNIPPPAVLLSVYPSIFSSAQDALFGPMAKLDLKQRQMLLAHPATRLFLKGYLTLGIVLGHIIAGRRLRWKRDQYLAQGMRIGPSAAGGKGGMKLAGIDKGETAKEDREVLDVVTMWKGNLGKLRAAVTSASSAPKTSRLPPVPEIAEVMPMKSLKPTEGGFTAPHACALCGLKREERVAKVDVAVDDSFGEWWLDNMSMHVVCRDFWEEHKNKLKSR